MENKKVIDTNGCVNCSKKGQEAIECCKKTWEVNEHKPHSC